MRCLHGKVDSTISCVCTCSVGSAQCSAGCVVYGPGYMAAICVLLFLLRNLPTFSGQCCVPYIGSAGYIQDKETPAVNKEVDNRGENGK